VACNPAGIAPNVAESAMRFHARHALGTDEGTVHDSGGQDEHVARLQVDRCMENGDEVTCQARKH